MYAGKKGKGCRLIIVLIKEVRRSKRKNEENEDNG